MRIRLADVGDPLSLPMIGMRRDARARSLRFPSGDGSGGGSGNDTTEEELPEDEDDSEDENDENGSEDSGKEENDKDSSELAKAIRRRDRALREKRALQQRVKELESKESKEDKPDPVEVANQRLIRQSFRTQLAALGITEKEDQRAVLEVIRTDGITVDDDGADEDEIEDRISELRRIFTGTAPKQTRRTPRVDTRDKGGSGGEQTDPDAARYKRILTGRSRRG